MRWFSVPNKEWQIIAPFALIAPFHTILCQPGDYEPLITLLGGISAPAPDIKDNLFPKSQSVWDVKTVNLLIHHPIPSCLKAEGGGRSEASHSQAWQRRKLQNVRVRVVMTTLRRDWIVRMNTDTNPSAECHLVPWLISLCCACPLPHNYLEQKIFSLGFM